MAMKNDVIFAAAGNGKTYNLCKEAIGLSSESKKYILLVTYTNEGVRSLEKEYREQNSGVIDKNVTIMTWYSFLLSEFIKPYQCLIKLKYKKYKEEFKISIPENYIKSIAFYQDVATPRYYNGGHYQYFMNSIADIRKDNVSHLANRCIEDSDQRVIRRLENIYSHALFDELQDFAGWDLEILKQLFESNLYIKCVGDYKQATFRTNNSAKNKQYRDEKIRDFFMLYERQGICSMQYENSTRRFNQEICDFVNTIHNDKESTVIPADQAQESKIENAGVYIIDPKYIEEYCNQYQPVVLRWNKGSRIVFKHNCSIMNYGNSKGATFDRVIIVPTTTVISFILHKELITKDQMRSKFYVACTRPRHSIVFSVKMPINSEFFEPIQIRVGENSIPAYKYTEYRTTETV